MTFTHEPLTDAAADAERRSQLRAPECRLRKIGQYRLKPVLSASTLLAIVVVIAAGTVDEWIVAITAALIGTASAVYFLIVLMDDAAAEESRRDVIDAFTVATSLDLKYLLTMKEKHAEIGTALRAWAAKDLTIRNRDVRAVRAWVYQVEPVQERARILSELAQ